MTKKTALVLGLALLLVLAVGVGTALAQTTTSGNPGATLQQLFRSKLSANLGVDEAKLDQAFKSAATQAVDAAVQQGLLPAEKAEKMREAVENGQWPWFWGGRGFGGLRGGNFCKELAGVLGMNSEELINELKAGKTMEEIAKSKGFTLEQLKEKWLDSVKAALDQQVQQGKLTSDQAQKILSRLQNVDLSKAPFCKAPDGKGAFSRPRVGRFGKSNKPNSGQSGASSQT